MRRLAFLLVFALLWAAPVYGQATLGSQNYAASAASATPITLTNVDAGAAVVVRIFQAGTSSRGYTVTDDNGNSYAVANTSPLCAGSGRCVEAWADYSVVGASTLTITVTQDSTHQAYHVIAYEVNCTTACAFDAGSGITNGVATTAHDASLDSTVIDTSPNVLVSAGCVAGSSLGSETAKGGWTLFTESSSLIFSQYISSASALTDERGTLTSGTARTTDCAILSVKDSTGGGGGGSGCAGLLLLGIGCEIEGFRWW